MSTPRTKIEAKVSPSLKQKLKAKARKQNTTVADILRDFAQKYVRG